MGESLGHKAVSGTIWATIDRFGNMGLQFVVNLVMARLLTPGDFGAVGVLAIFILVSQVLIDGGFCSALIQKKEPTQEHYSTIFWWNLALSCFLYTILFICAPLIADFFRMPILVGVLRVIGLVLPLNALSIIQNNRLRKQLQFRKLAIASLSAYILGASAGVAGAINGVGVWALVISQVGYSLFFAIILFAVTHWKPLLSFSGQCFKELFGFGGYILAANLLQEICFNFQGIIIGRRFNIVDMGYYSQAQKLQAVSSSALSGVIVQVMYPIYSSVQDDDLRLREILTMNIRVISFLVFPVLGFLILCAQSIITLLYGDQWLQSVPLFQILCVGGIFSCLQNINFYAVAAKGKSRILFYWSLYKWGMLLALLLVGMFFGLKGLMWSIVISNINIWAVNALLVQKYVGLRLTRQIRTFFPMILTVAFGLALGWGSIFYGTNIIVTILVFVTVVVLIPYLCHFRAISEVKDLISRLRHR